MACVEDDIREREAEEFGKGLDSKVELDLYTRLGGKYGCSNKGARQQN